MRFVTILSMSYTQRKPANQHAGARGFIKATELSSRAIIGSQEGRVNNLKKLFAGVEREAQRSFSFTLWLCGE
jgi:hypothetical protein